ncbi:hypothetical protein [Endozoicomonas sp. ALD040]|uniref:hypothetical protein n=1 Tax=Endozoicomonas sp. ALD040 TaxID=3403079 RepID=UPI003BAE3265
MELKTYELAYLPSEANESVVQTLLGNIKFEAFFAKKSDVNKLVVMFPGAIDRSKLSPPVYHRWSWHKRIHANVVVINDPTLYLADHLRIGWLVGTKDENYLKLAKEFLLDIIKKIFPATDEVCFYSSSAGGFMALQMAAEFPLKSKVLVNNCQTNILKYHKGHVKHFTDLCFPEMTHSDIENIYGERVSLIKRYENCTLPRTVYLQSVSDVFHLNNHCLPFIQSLGNDSIDNHSNLTVQFYRDDERGHGPLDQEKSLAALHKLLQE